MISVVKPYQWRLKDHGDPYASMWPPEAPFNTHMLNFSKMQARSENSVDGAHLKKQKKKRKNVLLPRSGEK